MITLLANSGWTLTALTALLVSGIPMLFLGWLAGRFLWRGEERRTRMMEAENRRLAKEAAMLERTCRDLETQSTPR